LPEFNSHNSVFLDAIASLKDSRVIIPIAFNKWKQMSETDLKKNLFSSLSSGGTRGEIVMAFRSSISLKKITQDDLSANEIAQLLRTSQIRFPNQKAKRILSNRKINLQQLLLDIESFGGKDLKHERWARLILRHELYGMGFKETSDFLKWIGFSKYLAVLDSINLKFLKWAGLLSNSIQPNMLSKIKTYYELENLENAIAKKSGINVSELDNLIISNWNNSIKGKKSN
jgi:thermostable 8-oxoguanine DNA glycosylase